MFIQISKFFLTNMVHLEICTNERLHLLCVPFLKLCCTYFQFFDSVYNILIMGQMP